MTRDIKYLVLALAMAATAGAVAPPTLRGAKDASGAETVGDIRIRRLVSRTTWCRRTT